LLHVRMNAARFVHPLPNFSSPSAETTVVPPPDGSSYVNVFVSLYIGFPVNAVLTPLTHTARSSSSTLREHVTVPA